MAWIRIDDQVPRHPKHLKAGPEACWLWVCGLAYCQSQLTDGFIPAEALTSLSNVRKPDEKAARLVSAGLWDVATGGYRVHDYLVYQPSAEQVRDKRAKGARRVATWKLAHGKVAGNATVTPLPAPGNTVTNAAPIPIPIVRTYVRTNTPPIGTGPHRSHAFCGRVCVPAVLHDELRRKLGGELEDADDRLRAWYREVDDELTRTQETVSLNDFAFWQTRFKLRWPPPADTPAARLAARNQRAADLALKALADEERQRKGAQHER